MALGRPKYIIEKVVLNDGTAAFNVVALGPHVVAKGLKYLEAASLAVALNEENKAR